MEVRVSVSHMEEPITNDSSDRFSHLEQKRARLEKAELITFRSQSQFWIFQTQRTPFDIEDKHRPLKLWDNMQHTQWEV